MNRECKLSKRAKTMPLDGMPPDETLFIEVSRCLKRFYEENIGDLCDRLAFEYGSVDCVLICSSVFD